MQCSLFAVCVALIALSTAPVDAGKTAVTPVQKVIEELEAMLAVGKEEKHKEEVAYSGKMAWCKGEVDAKTLSIKNAEATIEQQTAAIAKAESDAAVLSEEIEEAETEIAKLKAEAKNASEMRATENADYVAEHADFSESISAIKRAMQTLKARDFDVPQSLLQVARSPFVDEHSRAVLQSFLAVSSRFGSSDSAPEANAYDFQSGGVIEMLYKLKLKFQDQLTLLEKEEMNAKANFQLLYQQLTQDIKTLAATVEKKTAQKAGRLEDAATAKGDKKVTETGKAEDEASLDDTETECKAYKEEYEANQAVRADEIEALTKAIEILSSAAVSGNAKTYLPSALQTDAAALAHLRSAAQGGDRRERVSQFLKSRAVKVNSKYLALMATRVQADPFAKVKKMIKDLIVKLMEEANAEADSKAYCNTELATNKQVREDKSAEVDALTSKLEGKTAEEGQLTSQIADLSEEMKQIKVSQAEATTIRLADKATNAETVKAAVESQAAVEQAIKILKEFYEPGEGASAAFVQGSAGIKQQMVRAANGEPYKGMLGASTGVMGMLEVIMSDFVRLETETTSQEDTDAAAYKKYMDESTEDLAVKETELTHLTETSDETKAEIVELKKMIEATQGELDAALTYYAKLKADCVDMGFSYALRKEKREEEIQSLKEALAMLDGQDLA